MKSFIYTLSPRTRAGNVTAYIYRVKNNRPVFLGETSWNTASYAGERPEVVKFLMRNKHVPNGDHYLRPEKYYLESI